MKELPESLPEKYESNKKLAIVEHWMFVRELQELLALLQPDDWLTPTDTHNLLISRGEDKNIGIIDFSGNEIEFWDLE